jgi:cellulose synthase (UDP-forming)
LRLGWTFLLLEASRMAVGEILLHVFSCARHRSVEAAAHSTESLLGGIPLIDILIPTYNESTEILERTIIGGALLDYSHFRIQGLDDGRCPAVAALVERLGASYMTRPAGRHAKASNMNAALDRLLVLPDPLEVVAVFDVDCVVALAFLRHPRLLP